MAQRARRSSRVQWHHTKRNAEMTKMTTTKTLKSLLIAALLSTTAAHAADNRILVAQEDGKQVAAFKLNGSVCVLKNDQIRCAPVSK